jgi:predicted deacylase
VDNGIPAITLEIGPAKNWNRTLISRAENFIYRLIDDLQMDTTKALNHTGPVAVDLSQTYKATNVTSVSVMHSGWVELDVVPLQDVTEGEAVGTVYNSWGDVLQELTSPVTGRVLTVRVDAAVEQGAGVIDVVYNATSTD